MLQWAFLKTCSFGVQDLQCFSSSVMNRVGLHKWECFYISKKIRWVFFWLVGFWFLIVSSTRIPLAEEQVLSDMFTTVSHVKIGGLLVVGSQ